MSRSTIPVNSIVQNKRRRFSGRRPRILLCVASTIISLTVAIVAEKQIRRWMQSRYPDYGLYVQSDDSREGGYFVPNLNILATGEFGSEPIRLITNSKGFRNAKEFSYDLPEDTFRVMFMGDSYVAGFRTDQQQMIGNQLKTYLQNSPKVNFENYEVMISCESNPAACWYRYQQHGHRYNPHLVILGITIGNDVTPRDYKSSLWPEKNGSDEIVQLSKSAKPAAQKNGTPLLLPQDAYRPKAMTDFLLGIELNGREALGRRFSSWGNRVPPAIGHPGPNRRHHVHAAGNLTSLGLFYCPTMPEVDDWFCDFEKIIAGFKRQVAADDSEFMLVLFPTRFQVDERDWNSLAKFYCLDAHKFDLDYPNCRIWEFCKRNYISCLDLTPDFRSVIGERGDRLFMGRGDMHLNVDGQALAAQVLGEYIQSPGSGFESVRTGNISNMDVGKKYR